jgi:Fur family transcriptional regulator, ferric uptake regulator
VTNLSREEAKRLMHEAGLRATAPRVAVLRLLAGSTRPLSHSEVLEAVGVADWDQATLYRNLIKLVEVNLARVASTAGGIARYEARGEDDGPHLHPHFSCKSCGSVECLPGATLSSPIDKSWHRSLEEAELQIIGECPSCRSKPNAKKSKTTRASV